MNDCVFCGIVKENNPHHEIWWSNESHIAFLDASPNQRGHTLVIPRKHADELLALTEDEYLHLMADVRVVAKKMKTFFDVPRIAIVVEGLSVNHLHVHLIPVHKSGDLGVFSKYVSPEGEFEKLAEELRRL